MLRPVSEHSGGLGGGSYELDGRTSSVSNMSRSSVGSSFFIDDDDRTGDGVAMDTQNDKESIIRKDKYGNLRGFLHKKTRDGRWQKRFFEMNGVYLTYYKNEKMEKILAALSLLKVGDIRHIGEDINSDEKKDGKSKLNNNNDDNIGNTQAVFSLQLDGCDYFLRANTKNAALRWIAALKKVQTTNAGALNRIRTITRNPMQNGGKDTPKLSNESLGRWSKSEHSIFASLFCCCASKTKR